jgi:hypothetical protein
VDNSLLFINKLSIPLHLLIVIITKDDGGVQGSK